MTKISHISWGGYDKGSYAKSFNGILLWSDSDIFIKENYKKGLVKIHLNKSDFSILIIYLDLQNFETGFLMF